MIHCQTLKEITANNLINYGVLTWSKLQNTKTYLVSVILLKLIIDRFWFLETHNLVLLLLLRDCETAMIIIRI